MRVLVAHGSKMGGTAGIAATVGDWRDTGQVRAWAARVAAELAAPTLAT